MPHEESQYLVETDWLNEHLDDPTLCILEVTAMLTKELVNLARERSFDKGHIPGAVFLDMAGGWGSLSDQHADRPWTWPSKSQVESAMAAVGVNNDTFVVLYAGSPRPGIDFGPMWATRTWWILHHFGVRCAILNGGFEKWIAENRPLSTKTNAPAKGAFSATSDGRHAIATKKDVLAAQDQHLACIVDALSADSYSGRKPITGSKRKGHITGALNVPMTMMIDGNNTTFIEADTITSKFASAGVLIDKPIITYCGGGIAATLDAFALKLIGAPDVRVYDESLNEWSANETLPMSMEIK